MPNIATSNKEVKCAYCGFVINNGSRRSFSNHYRWSPDCFQQTVGNVSSKLSSTEIRADEDNQCSFIDCNDTHNNNVSTVSEDEESVNNFPTNCDTSLLDQFLEHEKSG